MRFMVMVKATEESEAGELPREEDMTAMANFNEELAKAGVWLSGEGLHASSKGARVSLTATEQIVTDGPFVEAKELIAGFWILQVGSKEEAIEWVKRIPCDRGNTYEIEIRQVAEADDFGDAYTAEARAADGRARAQGPAQA